MPKPTYYEGQIFDSDEPGKPSLVYRGGKFYPMDAQGNAVGAPAAKSAGGGLTNPDKTRIADAWKKADSALKLATDAEEFVGINRKEGTGGLRSIPMVAEALAPFNSNLANMMAISNRMAPNFRQAGDPSTKELVMYKRSAPNVDFPGHTNAEIADDLKSKSTRENAHAAFLDSWANHHGTLAGADAAFLKFWTNWQATHHKGGGKDRPSLDSIFGK